MWTSKIPKYSINKLNCDKVYREEAGKELKELLVGLPKEPASFTFYWRGKLNSIEDSLEVARLICEVIDTDIFKLTVVSKQSSFTYNYLEIA